MIALQNIDSKILDVMRMIDDVPRKIREAEAPVRECERTLDALKQRHEAVEKRKRERERALEDIDEKIKKLKARTAEIKTNKEYQALLKEIETVEHDRSSVEDDLLGVMEDSDALAKHLKTEEQNCKKTFESVERMKTEIGAEKEALERELRSMKDARTQVAGDIDSEIYSQYIMLIEIYHGHAVSEVRDEICQGCNMNIPPQLFVEIKKTEEIYQCPQCRRILFFRENPAEGAPAGSDLP